MKKIPVGLQVYTVNDQMQKDYAGTIEKIVRMGYDEIEIGGFGPFSIDEWNALLKKLNIKITSNHVALELMEASFNHIAEFNLAIGNKNLVCPVLREERRPDADGYKRTAAVLNSIGNKCREKGMTLHYHNHAFEFQKFDGKYGLDILFENTEPGLVMFQIDTYWVKYGGEDPAEYIKKFAGRCGMIHLKDMLGDEKRSFAEVGEGILDFNTIFKTAVEVGVETFIVEQDICRRPSLESAKLSIDNIGKIKKETGLL
ncbi:MAG: sugar phosphate isomerase/epimerase [Clostridiales bacterium]|nr:sugar phosphate isomerase/epimerase [Clostridiales bacterium]